MRMKPKNITIREDQVKWVEEKHINLSRFVQDKIDEELKK
jgi:post-segregation antitoxin (ccd killing protein)